MQRNHRALSKQSQLAHFSGEAAPEVAFASVDGRADATLAIPARARWAGRRGSGASKSPMSVARGRRIGEPRVREKRPSNHARQAFEVASGVEAGAVQARGGIHATVRIEDPF